VSGNKFVSTKDGSTIQIVGSNISGLEGRQSYWAPFQNATQSFWSSLLNYQSSGLNTIRLPLNEASWLNYTCYDSGSGGSADIYKSNGSGGYTPDPTGVYQTTVKTAVANLTAAGFYVILDLHWGAPNSASGQPYCPIGQPGFADADHSITFWKQLADTFKGNPAVMFELFNEPFGDNIFQNEVVQSGNTFAPGPDAKMLFTGGNFSPFDAQDNPNNNTMYTVSETWNVASMVSLLDTIRGEGATNVVLASSIGWAGEIETWLATYTGSGNPDSLKQFGVAWHVYGFARGTSAPLAVLAAGYPIVITETYGFDSTLDGKSNANGYTWAASENIGYIWWGWNDWDGTMSLLTSSPPWVSGTAP
jgi:endoglucanase